MRITVFEPVDRILVPFHALWLGVVVFLMINKTIMVTPFAVPIVAVFLGAGLYALVGRLIVRGLAVRSSEYTVTDRRLIVIMRVFGRRREFTEYLRVLQSPLLQEDNDGIGTIRFGSSRVLAQVRDMRQTQQVSFGNPLVLHGIPHARNVRDIIATAQRAPKDIGRLRPRRRGVEPRESGCRNEAMHQKVIIVDLSRGTGLAGWGGWTGAAQWAAAGSA
jgi:hypothetical protein